MGEPSKEAWDEAGELAPEHDMETRLVSNIAAALQRHVDVARDNELRLASRMEEIDDLSRELTAEIESHRVTRERAEKAERERDEARRVAKVLATNNYDSCTHGEGQHTARCEARQTALAYPDAKGDGHG